MIPNVLTVAGSDPSGGAGIQADLKTFAALEAYGLSAISAITVQNTRGVASVHPVDACVVAAQIASLFDDVDIASAKTGMLGDADIVSAVADGLKARGLELLVVDPVMVSTSGHLLLDEAGRMALRRTLLPQALVITPNLDEAGALLGTRAPASPAEMHDAARAIAGIGVPFVYLKGGHLALEDDCVVDVICASGATVELRHPRRNTSSTHGTGCTLSAAIAALLPQSAAPLDALVGAHGYLAATIAAAEQLTVGGGNGPLNHLHEFWTPVRE